MNIQTWSNGHQVNQLNKRIWKGKYVYHVIFWNNWNGIRFDGWMEAKAARTSSSAEFAIDCSKDSSWIFFIYVECEKEVKSSTEYLNTNGMCRVQKFQNLFSSIPEVSRVTFFLFSNNIPPWYLFIWEFILSTRITGCLVQSNHLAWCFYSKYT